MVDPSRCHVRTVSGDLQSSGVATMRTFPVVRCTHATISPVPAVCAIAIPPTTTAPTRIPASATAHRFCTIRTIDEPISPTPHEVPEDDGREGAERTQWWYHDGCEEVLARPRPVPGPLG